MINPEESITTTDALEQPKKNKHQLVRSTMAAVALLGAHVGAKDAFRPSSAEKPSPAVTQMIKLINTLRRDGKTTPSKTGANSVVTSVMLVEGRTREAHPLVIETPVKPTKANNFRTIQFDLAYSNKPLGDVRKQSSAELANEMHYETDVDLPSLMPVNPSEGALAPIELNSQGVMIGVLDNGVKFTAGVATKIP